MIERLRPGRCAYARWEPGDVTKYEILACRDPRPGAKVRAIALGRWRVPGDRYTSDLTFSLTDTDVFAEHYTSLMFETLLRLATEASSQVSVLEDLNERMRASFGPDARQFAEIALEGLRVEK